MSDTPKTDAAVQWMKDTGRWLDKFPEIVSAEDMRQLEREKEALRKLLVDAREKLDGAQSGYIPSCAEDEQWNTQRDGLVSRIDAAIKEKANG